MPYGSELFNLATSFDPYGAYTKGQAAPQEAAIEQQKRDVEQQKLSVQQKQLKELAGEKPAQEAPELAQMAQNPLGNDYTIKDAEGNSTFAAQAIPFVSKSADIKKQIAKNQQDIKMATAFGDNNLAANLSQEGRRLIDDLTRSESKIQEMKQQGSDSIISNVSLGAKDQKSYENVVKSTMDKLGLVKRPNWLPETWTPDLKDQIRGYASDKTATAIDNALDRRESEKRAVEQEKDRKRNQIAKERDDPLRHALLVKALNKGVDGEGGGSDAPIKGLPKTKDERESYIARYQSIKTINDISSMLENPKYSKFITPATQFTPQVISNLQQNFPELSQKLARIQAYEFSIGGKALTAQEQKILEPLYGWRGLNASQLKKRMEGVQQDFQKRNKLEQEMYPGLKTLEKKFDTVYEDSVETKKPPTETKKDSTKAPTVTTKEQYDALPEGTIYIEDGKQYQKPKKK